MYFFTTVEFYVILAVVAAAIVALASRPDSAGSVTELLMACNIDDEPAPLTPSVTLQCLDNGRIVITRSGVTGICGDGAVSLALEIKGLDIRIEERITPGHGLQMPSVSAWCILPFIRLERYHVAYNSATTGLFAAFTFPAKPGAEVERRLEVV